MKSKMSEKLAIPEGVSVKYENRTLTVKGPKGEVSRSFFSHEVKISVEGNLILLTCDVATRREQRMIFTFKSHLKNMITGVTTPWVYELRVCSSHFPMNVKVEGGMLKVKNFLGEKIDRECPIPSDVKVSVQGTQVRVESASLERAGNMASTIELTTRITKRDPRVFQDGIFIIKKGK